jgi:carbon storage regulator
MLVLARRAGEEIRIGADIEITITEITGSRVRIGITAPKEIPIIRKELEEKQKEGRKE